MNRKLQRIKRSGRDSIIKSALKIINENIDLNNYLIKVMANNTTIVVSFNIPIICIPLNTVFYYGFGVDLDNKSTWSNIVSNPNDFGTDRNNIPLYTPTELTKEHIQFVINAINKSDEIGSIDVQDLDFDDNMIIRENKDFYNITMLSTHQESWYKIDVKSGKISDSGHAHLIPQPAFEDDKDEYVEIK